MPHLWKYANISPVQNDIRHSARAGIPHAGGRPRSSEPWDQGSLPPTHPPGITIPRGSVPLPLLFRPSLTTGIEDCGRNQLQELQPWVLRSCQGWVWESLSARGSRRSWKSGGSRAAGSPFSRCVILSWRLNSGGACQKGRQ